MGCKDVCGLLEHSNHKRAIKLHLEDDEVTFCSLIDSMRRYQQTCLINESGLYSLILTSHLPKAKAIKRWITSEVLPSIRKTGQYSLTQKSDDEVIAIGYKAAVEKIERLERTVEIQKPKAESFDHFIAGDNLKGMNLVAKAIGAEYGLGEKKLFALLRKKDILFKKNGYNVPYQHYIDLRYFVVRERPVTRNGDTFNASTTLVTPKGEAWLARKLRDWFGPPQFSTELQFA